MPVPLGPARTTTRARDVTAASVVRIAAYDGAVALPALPVGPVRQRTAVIMGVLWLAFTALTGIPTADQIGAVVGTLKGIFSDPSKLATLENYDKAIDGVQGLLKPGESKNVPEEIEAFRKAFDDLLKQAGIKQLIVLIDDLDRCLPDTAIETLEAVRLFVFTARTAFIVAADEAMIEYSVRKHFPELPDTTGPRDYARNLSPVSAYGTDLRL